MCSFAVNVQKQTRSDVVINKRLLVYSVYVTGKKKKKEKKSMVWKLVGLKLRATGDLESIDSEKNKITFYHLRFGLKLPLKAIQHEGFSGCYHCFLNKLTLFSEKL